MLFFWNHPKGKYLHILYLVCVMNMFIHMWVYLWSYFLTYLFHILFIQLQLSITFQKHRMCFFCTASHSRLLRYWLPVWVPWFFSFIPIFMDVSRLVLSAQSPQDIPEIRSPARCTALLKSASHHLRDVFTKAIQGRGVVNHCLTFLEVNKRY